MKDFIACNFSYKSTERSNPSACMKLVTRYIDELGEVYHIPTQDAVSIFLRTLEGRAYLIEHAATKGIVMEYYEFGDPNSSTRSIQAYGFRMEKSEGLTGELLKI